MRQVFPGPKINLFNQDFYQFSYCKHSNTFEKAWLKEILCCELKKIVGDIPSRNLLSELKMYPLIQDFYNFPAVNN